MGGASGCAGKCAFPHVHRRNGVKVGTICKIDGLCWKAERARLREEREERVRAAVEARLEEGRRAARRTRI